jgi:hypothetical protein
MFDNIDTRGADALVGPEGVDTLELAVVLPGGALVLVFARLAV